MRKLIAALARRSRAHARRACRPLWAQTPPPAAYGPPINLEHGQEGGRRRGGRGEEERLARWRSPSSTSGGYLVHACTDGPYPVRLDRDRAAQGQGGGDLPAADQGVRGSPSRQAAPACGLLSLDGVIASRRRHSDHAGRQDHRRDRAAAAAPAPQDGQACKAGVDAFK